MLRIFICYGGREGETIGADLRRFLRDEGIEAFLASPRSPDIPSGEDYERFIDAKLLSSNLMVPICDSGIHGSTPALREIRLALDARKPIPIVPFVRKRCRLPDLMRNKWAPIRFDPLNPTTAYPRLLIEIYRRVDWEREKIEDPQITRPTEFPLSKVLKGILRRR